ncbi:type II toxin-antitoxin system RelE/ParE family toxin [Aureimonas sp. D3]|uniref:type II toxin-antitoxin system RelE/ParE family toxin n=1 Tax=Aureimonas sp. D3 TaxID=1638164 RepID=UPI00078461A8|nr:type II toxin-antitoxin system RelE/ParE family toxin [Aureimonas sp. D3]
MIESFRSKPLKRFWTKSDSSGLNAAWVDRIDRILAALDQASKPEAMKFPGFGFHALTGNLAGRYAVTVSRNWRITFGFDGQNAVDVDLEDYHGS